MNRFFFILIFIPATGFAARINGGGGASSGSGVASTLSVNDEGVQISSPTSQINFVGAGVTVTLGGSSTATVTIPGGAGASVYPATATASFPFGMSVSTISVSTITASSSTITGSQRISGNLNLFLDNSGSTSSLIHWISANGAIDNTLGWDQPSQFLVTNMSFQSAQLRGGNLSADKFVVTDADNVLVTTDVPNSLSLAGVVNTSTNPVDWSKLKNVPAGFADGTDDGGAGTADNLGSHVATQTITGGFGISVTTIVATSSSSLAGPVDISSTVYNSIYWIHTASPTHSQFDLHSFYDLIQQSRTDSALSGINKFTQVMQKNYAITGGVGVSDATYFPEINILGMCDNNSVNISLYQATRLDGVEWGNITLSGFTDPESATFMFYVRDSSGQPQVAYIAISEEQTNEIVIGTWTVTSTTATIVKGTSLVLRPTNMWTPSATVGMESLEWDPKRGQFYAFKQDTNFEFRVIKPDGTVNPVATEPWDAETILGALMPAINDVSYSACDDTLLLIGDATGASSSNQDIVKVNIMTGKIIDYWNDFVSDLGLNFAGNWGQSEGIAMTPDCENLYLSSEGNEAIWLRRRDNPITISTQNPVVVEMLDGRDVFRVQPTSVSVSMGNSTSSYVNVGGVFYSSHSALGNAAGAETEVFSTTFTMNSVNVASQTIQFYMNGDIAATVAVDKRVRVYVNTTTVFDSGSLAITSATGFELRGNIAFNSTSTVKGTGTFESLVNATPAITNIGGINTNGNVNIRGTSSATNASDVVKHSVILEWKAAP